MASDQIRQMVRFCPGDWGWGGGGRSARRPAGRRPLRPARGGRDGSCGILDGSGKHPEGSSARGSFCGGGGVALALRGWGVGATGSLWTPPPPRTPGPAAAAAAAGRSSSGCAAGECRCACVCPFFECLNVLDLPLGPLSPNFPNPPPRTPTPTASRSTSFSRRRTRRRTRSASRPSTTSTWRSRP